MVQVDENLTLKVANLARLELTPEEVKTFTGQLQQVLSYVDQLSKVDVKGIEPMTYPLSNDTPLRPDQAEPFGMDEKGHPKTLTHAPDVLNDGFKVPPIL